MINIILATLVVSLISLIGAAFLFKTEKMQGNYGGFLVSMAAGVMLATAILDLLPEALADGRNEKIYWVVLAGIVLFFILERFLVWHHHGHTHSHDREHVHTHEFALKPTAYMVLVGDSFHNFFDGVAIATSFSVSFSLGLATTVAIILHEIPQELADFVVLLKGGFSMGKALWFNFLSGLTAVLGAVLGFYLLEKIEGMLPYLIAFNAGMFIYISCADMIPALHEDFKKQRRWLQTLTFLFGIALMGVMGIYLQV